MKKPTSMIFSCLLITVLLSGSSLLLKAQNIAAFGVIRYNDEKLSGVSVKVFWQNKLTDQIVTSRNRGYGFTLEYNREYRIELAKEGYLKETILIDTRVPPEVLTLGDQVLWEPNFSMYRIIPGMTLDAFEKPLARYIFNKEYWGFLKDKEYQASVQPMLDEVTETIARQRAQTYNSIKTRADKLYREGNYEEAIIAYEEAVNYTHDNRYAADQIKSAKKMLRTQYSIDEGYRKAITLADAHYAKNEYEQAINYYQTALIYKPKEAYPLDRLFAIDSVKSYKWIEKNSRYEDLLTEGDEQLSQGNYSGALRSYNLALAIFPEKEYPHTMINKIDDLEEQRIKEGKLTAAQLEKRDQQLPEGGSDESSTENIFFGGKTNPNPGSGKEPDVDDPYGPLYYSDNNLEDSIDSPEELKTRELDTEQNLLLLKKNLEVKLQANDKKASSELLQEMGQLYQQDFRLNKALDSYTQSLELKRELGDKEGEAEMLSSIASVLYDSGSYNASIKNFEQSLQLTREMNDKQKSSELLTNIATVYENTYRYEEAIENLEQSLTLKEETGDREGASEVLKSIGNIYYEQNKYDEAIREMEKSLRIDEEEGRKNELSTTLNNLGASYYNKGQYNNAMNYYEQALILSRETNNLSDQALILNNMGNIRFDQKRYRDAIEYYEQSLQIKNNLSFREGVASTLHNIGNAYFMLKQFKTALEYYIQSQEVAEEVRYHEVIWRNYEAFGKTYAALGNYRSAYENYRLFSDTRINIERGNMQLVELRQQYESSMLTVKSLKKELQKQNRIARYEAAKNQQEMQIIRLEMENKQQQLNKQRIIIIAFVAILLMILVFATIITRQYRQKHKAYKIVAEQKKHITDGISYAARIQSAVLPPEKHLTNLLPEHFIINKPREQVGGDFYWAARHLGKSVIAVADCTGHGVPGGFMSMLGIAILNEIISTEEVLETHEILTHLRDRIMEALHQKKGATETMDGMDISLLIYDPKTRDIQFSGAYHTLYLIRDREIKMIRGDRIPIGYQFASRKFTSQKLQLQEGDMLYMTSDGFIDQIGEKSNKRFMLSRFRDELLSISGSSLIDQKKHLEEVLLDWKGSQEQTDDILVMGIRV
jgi:tetratricopeptide (TPR) repeat protein